MTRKLTKQTIKPVLKFLGGWNSNIYSLNTQGAKYYHFTLDTYNGKNSFQGGFDWWLEDSLKYDMYAVEFETGNVFNQSKEVVFNISEVKYR